MVSRNPNTGRSGKILSRFPSFMRTEQGGKALGDIALALGNDLDASEINMTAIQQSHRLVAADEERDVLRLAAIVGLQRADFLILRKFYEKGFFTRKIKNPASDAEREEKAYAAYLDELKESIQRIIRIMFDGCGTINALLEGASILINADDTGAIEHTDAAAPQGGFIHRLPVEYSIIKDDAPVLKKGFIYMVENPIIDKESEEKERRQRERFPVKRGGFFDGHVSITIKGVANRTVKPMVINQQTHQGVGFRGVLSEGQSLVFALDGKAYLDGTDVTEKCYYFKGALADLSPIDSSKTKDAFIKVKPEGAMNRNFPRPVIVPLGELPVVSLRLGESVWRFSVEEGAYDASCFDEAVFALPLTQEALDALPPSGKTKLNWREHEPFSVTVLIPADLKTLEAEILQGLDLREMVRSGLERFRAAGIKVGVDYFEDKWILGRSLIKESGTEAGEGVDFEGTNLS